tara:strand:- start:203 stop:592 length:390 start_codon:yes stop_codon:yes gene_type:complete
MILNLLTLSNFAYILPFVLAIEQGFKLHSIPYLLLFIASSIYHNDCETSKYRIYDQICAWGIIITNSIVIFLIYKKKLINVIISIILALLGFYIYLNYGKIEKKMEYNYEELHSLWHLISGIGSAILYC